MREEFGILTLVKLMGAIAQLVERVVRNDEVRGSIPLCSMLQASSGFLDEAGLQTNGDPIHFAGDLMVPVTEFDRLRLGASLKHLRAS